jgi:hypothetical protein
MATSFWKLSFVVILVVTLLVNATSGHDDDSFNEDDEDSSVYSEKTFVEHNLNNSGFPWRIAINYIGTGFFLHSLCKLSVMMWKRQK